jgi:hypothetical protein
MTIAEFEQTPRFRAFCEAAEAADFAAQIRIKQEAIAQTTGEEKALWLHFQETRSWTKKYFHPTDALQGWAELHAMLATAQDEMTRQNAIIRAVGLYGITQQTDLWANLFRELRPHLRLIKDSWAYCFNLGQLRLRQRRWRSAYLTITRAMTRRQRKKPHSQQSAAWVHIHANRAIAALACGQLERAMEDVALATALDAQFDRTYIEPYPLALAQAELALAQGNFQAARRALQEGMARATVCQQKPLPFQCAEFDLAAARIARAEGNMSSFHHFCEQALARCLEWNLRMTEVSVRAVMAGAER